MNKDNNIYDLLIIGAGPAGITAAIYATRAMLNFALFEKSFAGGQIINTYEVDNYPGIKNVSGFELSNMLADHATTLGAQIINEDVIELDLDGPIKKVKTNDNIYSAKTIIFATGAEWKKLGIPGEDKFTGLGVSYCATCDGAFYKDKTTVVVGGGDVAVEDAIYLARMCKKVYLVHRRNELRAVKILQERLFKTENIEVLWDNELKEIIGKDSVEAVKLINNKTNEEKVLNIDGVFIAVGTSPNSQLLEGKVEMDGSGSVLTDEDCETSSKGVFAAGDIRKKSLRQVITAAADGAISVFACEKYL